MEQKKDLKYVTIFYIATECIGISLIFLLGFWIIFYMGGFCWSKNYKLAFNWHPFLMTIGMIYLYGNAILVHRMFRNLSKEKVKLMHSGINVVAFIITLIALKATFDSHNYATPPVPNLFSIHSWLGLTTVVIFIIQWIGGFLTFYYPGFSENIIDKFIPIHVYLGLFGFVLGTCTSLMGLTEKAFVSMKYYNLMNCGLILNLIGVLMVTFCCLVVNLSTDNCYKRQSSPEDAMLLHKY